ncbi:uncharacterized protein arhgap20b isoform X1 [Hemibagrus wyckioides]|nr:uncharacterized protein arhgap20b isoform X1 [Hemibagrus wyckioides]
MMKMTVHRKQNVIKVFSKTRTLHSEENWEDHASQNALLLLEDHAHLTIGSETRGRLLLLSTDSLIVAKTKSLYLKVKARVSLSDIWLASCIQRVTNRKLSSKTSFVIGWPTTNYVVTLSSSETKDKWMCALQWHSVKARQSLIPNHMTLKVQLFDSVTAAVSVDVSSTAESVVQRVLQQNALTGGVSEYQLCVLDDGEEEVYPLIGHELPYCILLHSLRGQRSRHMLGRHQWHSADELHLNDDTNESTTPRFILKRRPAINTDIQTGSLKHKRKQSLIGWALRKGHAQSEAQPDLQLTANKLFGQSLSSLCPDGNLPKVIMDLLCMLYHQGPETLGIFRRSANAKSCRILKEKLNSGHPVSLCGESVFVAASVLTEFLRKLPGSVLGCDLYEAWMNVMKAVDEKDRYSSLKSVLAKLPQVNRTLLCYVFGVLHHIHTHSDVNQMTASNLALCIAPNMLWRGTTVNPEQESQSTLEVAALIRFLIESAPSIFGDEAEKTFTGLLNTEQQNDQLTADAPLPLHSSSEETDLDFLPSPVLSPDLEPFLPLSTLSFSGNRKLRPFKVSAKATDGYSCSTLGQSWDRCLSEPSMSFDAATRPQAPPHPPVIRQSSCDNAVIDNKIDQSKSPVLQSHSRGAGKGRYAFWKSPQFPARFRHSAQRLASMSSLSSTATSSLSSLDSFECVPSPNDDKPRPFLFGTSARLRPLTPEMPRKLWTMTFTQDELKDGDTDGERDKEKDRGAKHMDENVEDDLEAQKAEEDRKMKEDRSGVTEEGDGGMQAEEHETLHHDEGISHHMLVNNENRELGSVHTPSHTHSCPINTTHTTITLPSKRVKTSRMKITLFPSVGWRMFKPSTRVTMETGGEAVTIAQVNVPQTLFYNQNVNLVLQSDGGRCKISDADGVCTCNEAYVSKEPEDDASCELSINTTENSVPLSDTETGSKSGVDVSQTASNIRKSGSFNQSTAGVSQSDHRVSLNASASTHHKISINVNDSIQSNPGNGDSTPATTVHISSISCNSDSTHASPSASTSMSHTVSNSSLDCISDVNSVSHSSSPSFNTTATSMSHAVSISTISHSVSITPSNTNQDADASQKTSLRQTIRIRLPATVRNSVRAYFSPAHTLTHTHSTTHTHSETHTQSHTHTVSQSQNRPLFTSNLQ